MEIVDPKTKTLLPKDQLADLFKIKGVDLDKPIVTTCGSGVTAAMLYFALEYLGAKGPLGVYDGSWTEYASLPTSKILKK